MLEEYIDHIIDMQIVMPHQPPEEDVGNREYKWKLIFETPEDRVYKCHKLATQLNFRMTEGEGKAVYLIGVHDGGIAAGVDDVSLYTTLHLLTDAAKHIKHTTIDGIRLYKGVNGKIATIRFKNPTLMSVFMYH